MKKKLMCLVLSFALILSVSAVPMAAEGLSQTSMEVEGDVVQKTPKNYAQQLTLIKKADGSFQIADDISTLSSAALNVTVTAIEGTEVYSDNKNDYFMRISENRFVEADRISIDPYNLDELETVIDQYNIQKTAQDDLRKYMQRISSGLIVPTEDIRIYIPVENDLSATPYAGTRTTRTYTGYKNRQYYEELIAYSANSLSFNVAVPQSGFDVYIMNVMEAAVETALNTVADAVTANAWTLFSILFQSGGSSSIPTTTAYKHTAVLLENKQRKYTYVIQDGEYFIGSVLDYAYNYRFQNYINVQGYAVQDNGMTPVQASKVKGYNEADQLAYQNYLYYSYVDTIDAYLYKNSTANVTTRVDSMI